MVTSPTSIVSLRIYYSFLLWRVRAPTPLFLTFRVHQPTDLFPPNATSSLCLAHQELRPTYGDINASGAPHGWALRLDRTASRAHPLRLPHYILPS